MRAHAVRLRELAAEAHAESEAIAYAEARETLGGECSRCAECRVFFLRASLDRAGRCAKCTDTLAARERAKERARAASPALVRGVFVFARVTC
jgi:hypothetical protein